MLKFDYPEDYTGINLNHRIINEKRKLTDATSRVVTLDYGAFFINEYFVVRNAATARPLIPGRDYACVELDVLATEKSGIQVSTVILVQNKQVADIEIDYIFVGGQHMTGLHLIKQLKKIYPAGVEAKYHWDSVLNKPETFKAKAHQTHVKELYGFDGIASSIQDMVDALGFKDGRQANNTFAKVSQKLNEMNVQLDQFIAETEAELNQAFEDFRVQDNEFIFSNSSENPAVKRGYGNWVLVKNTILKGDNSENTYVVGNDSVIALGSKQVVSNVYVWKNQNNSKAPSYVITCAPHAGLPTTQRDEEKDIVFNITTTNLTVGTKLVWLLIDAKTKEAVSGHLLHTPVTGEAILDSQGTAQVIVRFKANTTTEQANRDYSFRLLRTNNALVNFTVLDSSLEKRIAVAFTIDSAGLFPVTKVEENQEFFLQIKYIGNWQRGEVAVLDWSASGVPVARIVSGANPAPKTLVVPSSPTEVYSLKVSANSLTDAKQTLLVYALHGIDQRISSGASYASVEVNDSSRFNYALLSFNNKSLNLVNVARVDEDCNFEIVIETNLVNTELNIVYNTTKAIRDFTGLLSTVITNAAGKVVISAATVSDFLTNVGSQSITVQVEHNNQTLGYNTLFINDTSKTPDYRVFFSKGDITQVITDVNEGEQFFLNIQVVGWQEGSRAPALEFNYTLDDDPNITDSALKARVHSNLYAAMLFGSSSSSYNEVTWLNNNTLRLEFTAIADKIVKGDTKFSVKVKQANQSQFDKAASLIINDTSIPTVVGTWSSSASVMTPIAQVDEMQSNGLNQRCYLWIDVDGDGVSFGDITLKSNSVNGVDFVTVFPTTLRLVNGSSRHILTVDAKADFIAEGDKSLFVAGSYKNSRNQDVELFRSTITLVDNSVLTTLNAATSTSPSSVVGASGFSEWLPFYAHLDFPAYAFDSQIEWRAVFTANPSGLEQLVATSGIIEVAKNTSSSVLTLTPIKDRLQDGESIFTLFYRRKIKATGQYITTEKSLAGIKILDDSLPMAVDFNVYTNAARTTIAPAFVDEGTKLYLRATVKNPDRNYAVCFAIKDAVVIQAAATDGVIFNTVTNSMVPSRIAMDDRKVVAIVPAATGASIVNVDVEVLIVSDRVSLPIIAVAPDGVRLEAMVLDNTTNAFPVNTVVPFNTTPVLRGVRNIGINDTSKTASYRIDGPSSVDEGKSLRLELNVFDGTVGDVYYPVLLSGISVDRLGVNELGLEQLAAVSNMAMAWNFKVNPDYKATGPLTLKFGFINKTTGKQIATKDVVLNDTSFEPVLTALIGFTNDPYTFNTVISEGETKHLIYISSSNQQLSTGEQIKIEWVAGRAANEFTGLFGTHIIPAPANGSTPTLSKPFSLAKDRKTNPPEENSLTVKITALNSGTSKNFTFSINDLSKTPAIRSAVWKNAVTGVVVSQVYEGERVRLELLTDGGTDPYGLTLTNDGGRSIGRLTSHEYGVKKTRSADNIAVSWEFSVKLDNTTNINNETMLKVRVVGDAGLIDQTFTLPIYDNSKTTTGRIEFNPDSSTTPITTIAEGLGFGVKYVLTEPDPDGTYRLLTYSNRVNDGWKIDNNFNTDQFYPFGSDQHTYKLVRETTNNAVVNTGGELAINAELWDVKNSRLLAASTLTLVDTSRPAIPTTAIIITTIGGTSHVNSLDEGVSADVYVAPSAFLGIDWSKESVKLYLDYHQSNNLTVFQVNAASLLPDGGFRGRFQIPADELTAIEQRSLIVGMYNLYTNIPGKEFIRGVSKLTTVKDTSTAPSIDAIYFSSIEPRYNEPGFGLDVLNSIKLQGESFYITVVCTGLQPRAMVNLSIDPSSTVINGDLLNWLGGVPKPVQVNRFDESNRVAGHILVGTLDEGTNIKILNSPQLSILGVSFREGNGFEYRRNAQVASVANGSSLAPALCMLNGTPVQFSDFQIVSIKQGFQTDGYKDEVVGLRMTPFPASIVELNCKYTIVVSNGQHYSKVFTRANTATGFVVSQRQIGATPSIFDEQLYSFLTANTGLTAVVNLEFY